ncbi:hypothetical protein PTKIN_Ptkin04bG0099900 [Pterospermum kingtungense]
MLDPTSDLLPPPSFPTICFVSSFDLDTESTGSFFHDRSITLASLEEFLEVERRFEDAKFYGATAELEGVRRKTNDEH